MKKTIRLTESDLHRIVGNCVKKILKEDNTPVDPQTAEKYKQIFIKVLQEYRPGLSQSFGTELDDKLTDLAIHTDEYGLDFDVERIPVEVEVTNWGGEEPEVNAYWDREGNVYPIASFVSPWSTHEPLFNGVLMVSTEDGTFEIPIDDDMKKAIDEYCTVDSSTANDLINNEEYPYEPEQGGWD